MGRVGSGDALGLVMRARQQLREQRPLLVAVDGRSGSGKTTLAGELEKGLVAAGVPAQVFHVEDLYQGWEGLAAAARVWQGLAEYVVQGRARPGSSAGFAPVWFGWDWVRSEPTGPHPLPLPEELGAGVLIVEGVGALTGAHDLGFYVEAPTALRKERALARDGDTYRPYWDMWAAQEEELLTDYAAAYSAPGLVRLAEGP